MSLKYLWGHLWISGEAQVYVGASVDIRRRSSICGGICGYQVRVKYLWGHLWISGEPQVSVGASVDIR